MDVSSVQCGTHFSFNRKSEKMFQKENKADVCGYAIDYLFLELNGARGLTVNAHAFYSVNVSSNLA